MVLVMVVSVYEGKGMPWFTIFAQFLMLSLLFQNQLVVICLELKGISNGSQ
jgi:hypothetical protein